MSTGKPFAAPAGPTSATFSATFLLLLLPLSAGCTRSASDLPRIHVKGSDTLVAVASAWAEAYQGALVEVGGGGSGIGMADLIKGSVDLANSSRPITKEEVAEARRRHGVEPVASLVGHDGIAIYVHRDNPLEEISLEDLRRIFGMEETSIAGPNSACPCQVAAGMKIVRVGRNTDSGTQETFARLVLGDKGRYKPGIVESLASRDLVTLIANVPCAIGYSGMGFASERVKVVRVKQGGGAGILPTAASVQEGAYPLSRPLYVYTLGAPGGAVRLYVDWIRSPAGQAILEKSHFVPLTAGE